MAVGTVEGPWPGLLSGVSQRPAAQGAPAAATQGGCFGMLQSMGSQSPPSS